LYFWEHSHQGKPICKIIDDGNGFLDRYTIFDISTSKNGKMEAVAACETGNGFYQHCEVSIDWALENKEKQVSLNSLNNSLQKRLIAEFGEEAFQ
jgi:hypothetical protein